MHINPILDRQKRKSKNKDEKQGKEKLPLVQRLGKEKKSTSLNSAEEKLTADDID